MLYVQLLRAYRKFFLPYLLFFLRFRCFGDLFLHDTFELNFYNFLLS
uniref:Uncharacterized protein n=1 Tax=Chlorella vulgaris TaxID=3077 RepID=V9H0S5_CHLVU|nr:hypothetical protein ChvulCp111 [Chlorella vulgaris]pir/T07298/ hypothetical protein 46b - Chlorella vulgaris chloroplast [Chlorella vulgaris]BAA57946.1 unnamed protein product [Chlorella vulgaris]